MEWPKYMRTIPTEVAKAMHCELFCFEHGVMIYSLCRIKRYYYTLNVTDSLGHNCMSRAFRVQEQMCIGNDSFGSPFC